MSINASEHSPYTEENNLPPGQSAFMPLAGSAWAMLPSSKLRAPEPPPAPLLRPDLIARAQLWRAYRLTVITAPAGYGKTTLALSALPTPPADADDLHALPTSHYAWLSVDEDDDTPTRFVQALAAALASLIPEPARAATLLALGQQEPQRALWLLLTALEGLSAPVLLVLDNYHRLHSPAVHELMGHALEYTSENVHWLILTRQMLPISLGRLRLQRHVLEFTIDDLRLNRAEIQALLELHGVWVADADMLDLLEVRTQGWWAGLQLTLLSFQSKSGVGTGIRRTADARQTIHALFEGLRGDRMLVAEYLTGEVLAHISEPLRSFLLRCAILERLHPKLCTAVTGIAESARLLQQAVAQQLFIWPLDEKGEWYEQHHLFRDLLLHYLRAEETETLINSLHRRAADWYVAEGNLVAALHALLTGGFPSLAAALVESRAQDAILNNHLAELHQWLELLPLDQVDARPRLLLDSAWLSFMRGVDFPPTLDWVTAALAAHSPLPKPWQDEVMTLGLLRRFYVGPRHNLHHDALAAAEAFDPASHWARGWALYIAALLMDQAPGQPLAALTQAASAAFRGAGFARGQVYVLARQVQDDLLTGHTENLLGSARQALSLIARQSRSEPTDGMFFNFSAGEALYWQNRIPEAVAYFRQVWQDAQTYQDSCFLLQAQAALALCANGSGQAMSLPALDPAEQARHWQQAHELYPIGTRGALVLWQLRVGIVRGAPAFALREFDALGITLDTIPEDAPDSCWLALLTAYITRGERLEQLTPGLELLLRRAQNHDSPYLRIQTDLLLARQLHQLGRRNAARGVVRQLLRDVESCGYVRMVLDQPALTPLLQLAGSDYAKWLLSQMMGPPDAPTAPPFSSREERLLALLAVGYTSAQIAEQLVVSATTTRSYLSRLYAKLGVKNHAQAVAWARNRPSS